MNINSQENKDILVNYPNINGSISAKDNKV